MKITIEGTKAEIAEIIAEIRKRDKEYITIPYYPHLTNPYKPTIVCTDHTDPCKTVTRPEDIKTTHATFGDLYER